MAVTIRKLPGKPVAIMKENRTVVIVAGWDAVLFDDINEELFCKDAFLSLKTSILCGLKSS